jgi:hypothetical protein
VTTWINGQVSQEQNRSTTKIRWKKLETCKRISLYRGNRVADTLQSVRSANRECIESFYLCSICAQVLFGLGSWEPIFSSFVIISLQMISYAQNAQLYMGPLSPLRRTRFVFPISVSLQMIQNTLSWERFVISWSTKVFTHGREILTKESITSRIEP